VSTLLNGFELAFSAEGFNAFVQDMPSPEALRDLRESERGEWFFHWRDGQLYAIPEVEVPTRSYGVRQTLSTTDHRHLGLLAARINERLPEKFPKYDALQRRPFAFLGKKDELVSRCTQDWTNVPPLLAAFTIRPRLELDARLYELRDGETRVGLFVSASTKWSILATPSDLQRAGVELRGLHVVRKAPGPEERRLVGEIDSLRGSTIVLSRAFDDVQEIAEEAVWIEGNRRAFRICLDVLLRGRYEEFDRRRQSAEGDLLGGPGIEQLCQTMGGVLDKASPIAISRDIECRVIGRIAVANVGAYKSVVDVGSGDYCFDPARAKRRPYAWQGLEHFGPYSRDTFPKKSPRVLVLAPDNCAGKVGQFVNLLRGGITSVPDSHYAGGFAKVFHLHNPEFVTANVPLAGVRPREAFAKYRQTIETTLRRSADYDVALVALPDELSRLDDAVSPYLHAKASFLMSGIPTQQFRLSTASGPDYGLQYVLQNIALSMYAKMGGVPWTVDQGLAVDDEVVLGMGVAELSDSRYDRRQRYVGITTVFRGDGNYLLGHLSRDCEYEAYPRLLEENTAQLLQELRERNGWRNGDTVRIVFHAHKPLKRVEVAQIVRTCVDRAGAGLNVQFAFLSVLHEHPFKVLDPQQRGLLASRRTGEMKAKMVPPRGRVVQLGRFTRLLCTKGPTLIKRAATPLPSPILIKLHDESTYRDLQYLSEQILKFTSLSWRGTQPAEDPVTIYYSELMADLLAKLRGVSGWSPDILNTRLRHSMWFL
jgi:hypothetical protein